MGHITKDELLRHLDATEMANGFANRFLWVCAKRSKILPDGGNLRDSDFNSVITQVRSALEFAHKGHVLQWDAEARALWHEVYPGLSEGLPGMLGAITGRAEAQVVRLSVAYALLDRSEKIQVEHLKAGLACWKYCFASAKYIFGDSLGDPLADEVLRLVRQSSNGVTRTELSNYFGRHQSSERLSGVITNLMTLGLVRVTSESTGGRPVERICANEP
jgi:hypothetical protein